MTTDFQLGTMSGAHLFDVPVRNTTGAAIASGVLLAIDPTEPWDNTGAVGIAVCGASDMPYAVTLSTLGAGLSGPARRLGIARLTASGTVTAGDVVMPAADGKVATQTSGAAQAGKP